MVIRGSVPSGDRTGGADPGCAQSTGHSQVNPGCAIIQEAVLKSRFLHGHVPIGSKSLLADWNIIFQSPQDGYITGTL